jgi:hypothetical protein
VASGTRFVHPLPAKILTITEAHAALRAAPKDKQLSAVEPNVTRGQLFTLTFQALEKLPPHLIDVSPALARHIACVAQDTITPAPMRFIYHSDGVMVAGWNREQQGLVAARAKAAQYLARGQAVKKDLQDAQDAKKAQTKVEQPPDPTSPKFVLKRPKV